MGHVMAVVYAGKADIAYPHFFHPHRSIARITLRHDLPELIVVLPGHHPRRRSRYELGSIQRRALIHVRVAAESPVENAGVSLEELPHRFFHRSFSSRSHGQTLSLPLSSGLPDQFAELSWAVATVCLAVNSSGRSRFALAARFEPSLWRQADLDACRRM